jgi:hypothetical protein
MNSQLKLSTIVSIILILAGIFCMVMTAAGNPIGHRGLVYGIVLTLGGATRLWMNRHA